LGGLFMGVGISAMHYIGMASMRMDAMIHWNLLIVGLSILIAGVVSLVAIGLVFHLRAVAARGGELRRIVAAGVMGVAVAGMHYTGMAAAHFSYMAMPLSKAHVVSSELLGNGAITLVTVLVLGLALGVAGLDRRFSAQEQSLIESRQHVRMVVANAPVILISLDTNGTITLAQGQGLIALGRTPEDLQGRSFFDVYGDVPDLVEQGRRALAGEEHTGQYAVQGMTLEVRWVPVRDDHDHVSGVIAVATDITDRVRAEEALREKAAALELANADLDRASRVKSEFLATMSHEIRTPMNGVIGMGELLLDTPLNAEQREYVETMNRSGESLLMIINDILDYAKIEAGKMRLEAFDVDVRTTVEDVMGLLAKRAHDKGLEVVGFTGPDVPAMLQGDPFRLRQILTNLVGNAIKFTDQGEVILRATRAEEDADSVLLRYEVIDTGIGISTEEQQRLFQAFTQADSSTTRKYGGTGLGLAISQQLVKLMGGEIGVKSASGQGSIFWFTTRMRKQLVGVTLPVSPEQADLRGLRVLIVDDNATNRTILYGQISSWGMNGDCAEGGSDALVLLRAAVGQGKPYDLVILDMHMPEMDGLELARTITDDPAIAGVRLVLLTSGGMHQIEDVRPVGISRVMTKPVRQAALYNSLATVMGGTDSAVPLAIAAQPPARESGPPTQEAETAATHRILLAEDNAINQTVAIRMLRKLSYGVDVVAHGRAAVEAMAEVLDGRRLAYSAILMDCQMPEMDGYAATAAIRELEGAGRRIPIIAMTASVLAEERERCVAAGMDDYVSKPVTLDKLGLVLRHWTAAVDETGTSPIETGPNVVPQEAAIDAAVIAGLRDLQEYGEPDLVEELISLFLGGTPPRLHALRDAATRGEGSALAREAHLLKGSCASLGARPMAHICEELEAIGREEDLTPVGAAMDRLTSEYEHVQATLRTDYARV